MRGTVLALAIAPLAVLAAGAFSDELGANPIEKLSHETGGWALRFLLASLAITPLRRALGRAGPASRLARYLAPYRRSFGLLAFSYATLHMCVYVFLDLYFDWAAIAEDVLERPYVTAGFGALLCMLPLAITSTRAWIRRLGPRWVALHRLAYAAGLLAALHFLWLVKADLLEPAIYAAILLVALGTRVWLRFRRVPAPRRSAA